MLNELLTLERGVRQAGIPVTPRHPDIKDVGLVPTVIVRLTTTGHVGSVYALPSQVVMWTLRDGQHNSFPFIKLPAPLWHPSAGDKRQGAKKGEKTASRRAGVLAMTESATCQVKSFKNWPGDGLLARLRERKEQMVSLLDMEAAVFSATIDRLLLACTLPGGGTTFLREVAVAIIKGLGKTADPAFVEAACAILQEGGGAIICEADGFGQAIYAARTRDHVSEALLAGQGKRAVSDVAEGIPVCGLTGQAMRLVEDTFPQPNLPILGQTYLFARNKDTMASHRYRRFSARSMPVGQDTANALAAALATLTDPVRKGLTWRAIPSERPRQSDLLLVFVDEAPDAHAVGILAGDDFEDESRAKDGAASREEATFEKRAERVLKAVEARVGADFRKTPVHVMILRRVDPANRKVVYAGAPCVSDIYDAAMDWSSGERNVPPWLVLPVWRKGKLATHQMTPPHVAPLGMMSFSKAVFLRGGVDRQEVAGIAASEAMELFVDTRTDGGIRAQLHVRRLLRMVLSRRGCLISGAAHALRRGLNHAKEYDRLEALRTVTMLGVLLHKAGRTRDKENYMEDAAFKLGQLLAAADVVHAGYCADVRGGDVPPALLGNQVFAMAQKAPVKALALLCRKWKPYDGWAKKASRQPGRADGLTASKDKTEQQRGWSIKKALRQSREMGALAGELAPALKSCTPNETFQAELLLGYMAGLPKVKDGGAGNGQTAGLAEQED